MSIIGEIWEEWYDELRDLFREVVNAAEGCHGCISRDLNEDLITRMQKVGVWPPKDVG